MVKVINIIITILVQVTGIVNTPRDLQKDASDLVIISEVITNNVSKTNALSRRKRFLIFTEGSSLQLVFCVTYPTIFAIGDIFLWGYTSALAFELPQDPYSPFMHHADPLHRRVDTKAIYYTDEDGKILYKRPYQRNFIVNPVLAKRSIDATMDESELKKVIQDFKIDRKQMHVETNNREFLKREHMDRRSAEFHRSSRKDFYQKVEIMLQGAGVDGKQCLLKTLCLMGQSENHPQGYFLQEILRAVFTLPKSETDNIEYRAYDEAWSAKQSCDELYPECEQPLDLDASSVRS